MRDVYLDCSGLHNIRLDGELPNTIYIEGQQFINQLNQAIDRLEMPKSKEEKRWELIIALASNPSAVEIGCSYDDNADMVIKQADAIIKQLEEEKK